MSKKHHYLFSVKNRFGHFRQLCRQLVGIYQKSDAELFFSVTDFRSEDGNIREFLDGLNVPYCLFDGGQTFNLGLGWNTAAQSEKIEGGGICIFLTNDLDISADFDLPGEINKYTVKGKEIFIPFNLWELEDKIKTDDRSGASLWAVYKEDFLNTPGIAESESWADAGADKTPFLMGEEYVFINDCEKIGLQINRPKCNGILSLWHPKPASNPWYGNSHTLARKRNRITRFGFSVKRIWWRLKNFFNQTD